MSEPVRMTLDNGAILEFHDLLWTNSGRLFCKAIGYAPDASLIGNSKVEMSSGQARYRLAQEFASHNGAKPDIWADALLAAWHTLDAERQGAAEQFSLESLEGEEEPGPLNFVWAPLIPEGFPANIYGDGGASKSTTVMGLSVAITQGLPFLGLPTMRGPIFYLDWEMNKSAFLRRLYSICRGMGLSQPPRDLHYSQLREPLAYHLDAILDACHRIDPVLVVLDSLGIAATADPNDAESFIKITQELRKLERACFSIDHQSKGTGQSYRSKRAIGSGYKDFLVRGGVQLELASSVPGRASVVLRHSKHTFTHEHEPIAFHIHYGMGSTEFELADTTDAAFAEADLLPLHLRIHRILEETTIPMEMEVLIEASGASSKQVFLNAITKLRRQGVKIDSATSQGKTYYSLATKRQ